MKTKLNFLAVGLLLTAATAAAQPTFTQITNGPIATDPGQFVGCVWADFNNHGFLDLLVCNYGINGGASPGTNVFYRNNGDGTFTKISQGDPVQDADWHIYAGAGDYDNDGFLDLIVSAGVGAPSARRNILYHNNGDGTFSRVSGGSVTNRLGFFGPALWGDYDHDGFLDLFFANHGDQNNDGGKNLLFHNNGDGTFTNLTSGAVVTDVGVGYCATWEDYDNDGFVDLLVINNEPNAKNFLYHNNRDGTFTRVLTGIVATDLWSQGAACAAWGDYDNDGFPDLFVTDAGGGRNQLYHNNGGGTFTRVTSGPELAPSAAGTFNGCAWGDYDNDGYLDLVVSGVNEKNALFHNNGDGTFTQILSGPPVQGGGPGIVCGAVSWVDYDNDGFLDLFVGMFANNNSAHSQGTNLLYHNNGKINGNTNAWLEVKLVGTVANRTALGAKVRAHATIGGKTFWQLREINGGGGYGTAPLVAHFGLGNATNVDTLRIEWPSGTVQELANVVPRQILTVTEPPRLLPSITNGIPQFSLKGGRGFQYDIQASTDLAAWSSIGTVTVTNLSGTARIIDTNAPGSGGRFYRAVSR